MAAPKTWYADGSPERESAACRIISHTYAESRLRPRPDAEVHRQPAAGHQQGRHLQRPPPGRHVAGLSSLSAPDQFGMGPVLRSTVSGLPGGEYALQIGRASCRERV